MNGIAEELAVFIVVGAHIIIGETGTDVIGAGKELEEARLVGVHLRQPQEGVVNVPPLIALQVLVEVERIGRRGIQLCLYGGVLCSLGVGGGQGMAGEKQIAFIIQL